MHCEFEDFNTKGFGVFLQLCVNWIIISAAEFLLKSEWIVFFFGHTAAVILTLMFFFKTKNTWALTTKNLEVSGVD